MMFYFVSFKENQAGDAIALPHVVSLPLSSLLVHDLEERGAGAVDKIEPVKEVFLDMPGLVAVDRPIEEFWVYDPKLGLKVLIPSEDVQTFVRRMAVLPRRRFFGHTDYYKIVARNRVLVLEPRYFDSLFNDLKEREARAEERATVFYRDRPSPAQVLREANAKATGIPIDQLPDLSGDKLKRFYKKD